MTMRNELSFPGLEIAARRLRMNMDDKLGWVEAAVHAVGNGASEQEAMTMTLQEHLRRKGKYRGVLKELVDSGAVFQLRENEDDDNPPTKPRRPFPGPWRQTDKRRIQRDGENRKSP